MNSSATGQSGVSAGEMFVSVGGAVLLGAGLTRVLVLLGRSPMLTEPEPVLGVSLRIAVLLVGVLELGFGLYGLFGRRLRWQLSLMLWLLLNYVVYRVGLVFMGCHPEWTCIGSLSDPLRLGRGTAGFITAYAMPGFLLVGSVVLLTMPKLARWCPIRTHYQRMFCPSCGGHIKFHVRNLGQRIPCPHCATEVELEPHDVLKMSCFFCHKHIEFPAHAAGTKTKCPHCGKDITLKLNPALEDAPA